MVEKIASSAWFKWLGRNIIYRNEYRKFSIQKMLDKQHYDDNGNFHRGVNTGRKSWAEQCGIKTIIRWN